MLKSCAKYYRMDENNDEIVLRQHIHRQYPRIRGGTTVYVVVEVNRMRVTTGVVDRQSDIEVRGVFSILRNAELYVNRIGGLDRHIVIHQTVINPCI